MSTGVDTALDAGCHWGYHEIARFALGSPLQYNAVMLEQRYRVGMYIPGPCSCRACLETCPSRESTGT